MKQKIITLAIVLLLSLSLGVQNTFAHTMGSSNFVIDGANFDSGGGNSSSSNYSLSNTSGENYLDFAQSSNFINNPGLVLAATPTPTTIPGSTSSSSSSSSSTSGSGTSSACTAAKPGSAPTLLSATPGANGVILTWSKAKDPVTHYLVAYGTSPGSIQYGNPNAGGSGTTSYTVSGLSGGTYFFKVKAINDCMPGDFSNELSAALGGGTTVATENIVPEPAEGFVPAAEIPSQLFDIALIIDDQLIEDSRTLTARVTFTSFGTEDTPVDMVFIILDASGKELYRINGKTVIQTEGVYNQKFLDLVIADGKYTLLLKTSYGESVLDEFRQPFEVRNSACTGLTCAPCTYVWWIVPLELITIAILLWRKRRRKEEEQHA